MFAYSASLDSRVSPVWQLLLSPCFDRSEPFRLIALSLLGVQEGAMDGALTSRIRGALQSISFSGKAV